jgi:ATP-dependent Clp protease ATP-binding subunit ClpB
VFHVLAREHLRKIADIPLGHLADRLKDRKIKLGFTDKARDQIMDERYDPSYGARALKRTIQRRLENPLATELPAGKFADGDTIGVDAHTHGFFFEKASKS